MPPASDHTPVKIEKTNNELLLSLSSLPAGDRARPHDGSKACRGQHDSGGVRAGGEKLEKLPRYTGSPEGNTVINVACGL